MGLIPEAIILAINNRFRQMFGNEFRWGKTKVFNFSGLNMGNVS